MPAGSSPWTEPTTSTRREASGLPLAEATIGRPCTECPIVVRTSAGAPEVAAQSRAQVSAARTAARPEAFT